MTVSNPDDPVGRLMTMLDRNAPAAEVVAFVTRALREAYAAGASEMRERAAMMVDAWYPTGRASDIDSLAVHIRALPIDPPPTTPQSPRAGR